MNAGEPASWKMPFTEIILENTTTDNKNIRLKAHYMYRLVRIQLIVLTASVFFYATYAFASSNSNFHPGGEGVNMISGWAVSNINYHLAEDPSKISAVEFDLDGSAEMVKASINSSSDAFFTCVNTIGTHWICNINQESVSTANELRVIASVN